MLVLWQSAPQTVGALGKALYLDSGTLTPLLKRLEASGLVERTRDAHDERRVLIDLTQRGQDLREAASRVPHALQEATRCTEDEARALRDLVYALIEQLPLQ
jgi:DNA-binding MarR family transcriptional regulator